MRMAGSTDHPAATVVSSSYTNPTQTYSQPQLPQFHQASTAPIQYNHHASSATSNYSQTQHHSAATSSYPTSHIDHSRYSHSQTPYRGVAVAGSANPVRPHEIFRLSEQANAQIPEEVRQQFQQDDQGNVLFFTAPPVDVLPPLKEGSAVGHSARYLAEKLRRKMALKEKRKAQGLPEEVEEPVQKKVKHEIDESLPGKILDLREKALQLLIDQTQEGTDAIHKELYGPEWKEGAMYEAQKLTERQINAQKKQAALQEAERRKKERETVPIEGIGVYLDDFDPRY